MTTTTELVKFCDQRTNQKNIPDFKGSHNGLQIANDGTVAKIGAAVDAGFAPFDQAVRAEVDFLIVHHGLFWIPPIPITGKAYEKTKLCIESNLAVYGSHLPLDCHPEIGNNRLLADKLELSPEATFLPYEGVDIGLVATCSYNLKELRERLSALFPKGFHSMEFGSKNPEKIAILTGSGQSAVDQILSAGADTLVTGELKQHHFNLAQELGINLYTCGHYATETFGVDALAQEVANTFDLPYEFIDMECPL